MSEVGLQLEPLRVPTQTTYPRQYRIAVSAALRCESDCVGAPVARELEATHSTRGFQTVMPLSRPLRSSAVSSECPRRGFNASASEA